MIKQCKNNYTYTKKISNKDIKLTHIEIRFSIIFMSLSPVVHNFYFILRKKKLLVLIIRYPIFVSVTRCHIQLVFPLTMPAYERLSAVCGLQSLTV